MTAARTGDTATLDALIAARRARQRDREVGKDRRRLMWAAHENNAPAIAALLAGRRRARRAVDGAGDFSALLFAVRAGSVDADACPARSGRRCERRAARRHERARARRDQRCTTRSPRELLERGAEPNAAAQGWTALHQIAWSRRWNMGFNLPGPAQTRPARQPRARPPARRARRRRRRAADEEPADGNRNKLDRLGATPFVLAAKSLRLAADGRCSSSAPTPRLTTNAGTTALMAAAGVGIWAPGENPGTARRSASRRVKLALEAGGGDVNASTSNETALHGAVYRGGSLALIEFLADAASSLDVVNSRVGRRCASPTASSSTASCSFAIPRPPRSCASCCAHAGCPFRPSSADGPHEDQGRGGHRLARRSSGRNRNVCS